MSYGKVDNLDMLDGKLRKPFDNHLRLLCGHCLRVRGRKLYLVHQTARAFLLNYGIKAAFNMGSYLRPFGWNIDRPTAVEWALLEKGTLKPPYATDQWAHTISLDVANRYLLQVCVDYIKLFDTTAEKHFKRKEGDIKYLA